MFSGKAASTASPMSAAPARRGQFDPAPAALQQHDAKSGFEALDPGARRGQREMHLQRAACDAAGIRHRDEQLEINQIEMHGNPCCHLPSAWPKVHSTTGRLCDQRRSVNVFGCSSLCCF
jgi:hypothetical protein